MMRAPVLIDIGLNLAHRSFDVDRPAVLERAKAAGVTQMIVTGTSLAVSTQALALAHQHPGMLAATAGIHPHHAKDFDAATLTALRELHRDPSVVAVGECGLDYNRNFSPPDAQLRCLDAHLTLAAELNKPVFLHERDAFAAMHEVLARHRPHGVVHCFTADRRALDTWLELGLHIGITGWICDRRRGTDLLELVKHVPLNRLMLETDAPFLSPRKRERRNEPAFLPDVLQAVADARGQSPEEVAAGTTATARRLFGLR